MTKYGPHSTLSMNIIKIDQIKSYLSLGYCCVLFMQCSSTTFRINNAGIAAFTTAKVGTNCSEDYIGIEGIYRKSCHRKGTYIRMLLYSCFLLMFVGSSNSGFATQSRYCGGFLNSYDTATIDTKVRGVYSAMNLNSPFQMKIRIIFIPKTFLNQFSRLYGTF